MGVPSIIKTVAIAGARQFEEPFYWTQVYVPEVRSMGPGVCPSVYNRPFADLTGVTLADEDTNSILN